jgi:hypothetical protein
MVSPSRASIDAGPLLNRFSVRDDRGGGKPLRRYRAPADIAGKKSLRKSER